jgi:hypothetical protein
MTFYCQATAYPVNRRAGRGYRMADDKCKCGAPLVRKQPETPVRHEYGRYCAEHDCYGKGIDLIASAEVRRVYNGISHSGNGKVINHFSLKQLCTCPVCGSAFDKYVGSVSVTQEAS